MRRFTSRTNRFLVLLVILTLPSYVWILRAGDLADTSLAIFILMWGPGLAALITQWTTTGGIAGLGWQWPGWRTTWLALALPLGACIVVYGLAWWTGLVPYSSRQVLDAAAARVGEQASSLPVVLLVTILVSFPLGLLAALGEEIGWRGFLVPELARTHRFATVVWISALIWLLFHAPIMLYGGYRSRAPLGYGLLMFALMVLGISVVLTWWRLDSGSVWPAALFHASHNLFVQAVFDPLAVDVQPAPYLIGEFGLGLALVYGLVALYFWHRRGEIAQKVVQAGTPRG